MSRGIRSLVRLDLDVASGSRLGAEARRLAVRDYAVPMRHEIDSLNVSVAVGVALYERSAGRDDLSSTGAARVELFTG